MSTHDQLIPPELDCLVIWCARTNHTYPKTLIETFAARRNHFNLICELLDEHADPITSPQGAPVGGGWKRVTGPDLLQVADTGIILTGAAVSVARSWVDTVLHICNQLLFDEPLSDGKVFPDDRFLNKIREVQHPVYNALKEILGTDEYRYLNDLTNTMKHRELIHSRVVLGSNGSAIVVEPFEKDGRSWNECTVTEIVERCETLFRDLTSLLFSIPERTVASTQQGRNQE